ncbi:hypothetical protein [Asticcacaulis sp. W401b]|uniref:hypothetical protein n=1 Tax=Asticcacaulis sp. W401b TaxID=3388666 RepID=UPI003970973D
MVVKLSRGTTLSATLLFLTGCATSGTLGQVNNLQLLHDALTVPLSELEARASEGDARAQYSTGIAYEYGFGAADKHSTKALQYKQLGLAARGSTPITQYIAGLDGKPGRTAIINVPNYNVTRAEARVNDQCAAAVAERRPNSAGATVCGSVSVYKELLELAAEQES